MYVFLTKPWKAKNVFLILISSRGKRGTPVVAQYVFDYDLKPQHRSPFLR